MTMLVINARAWSQLKADVLRRLPEEACGVLLGQGGLVLETFPCRNAFDGDRRRFYELAPGDQFDCVRYARSAGLEWVAYYHSHPNGVCDFSLDDRARALPGSRHVVVAVRGGEVLYPRAWRASAAH
jgi:proteasome lid subunit RPN8/RPN11